MKNVVDGRPLIRVVRVALAFVRRCAGESVMCCAHPGLPIQVAPFDGHSQHGWLEGRSCLRNLLPPIIGYRWDNEAAIREPLCEPLAHEPEKRFPGDCETHAVLVRQFLRT